MMLRPELTDWLRKRAQDNSFKLLENENNLFRCNRQQMA